MDMREIIEYAFKFALKSGADEVDSLGISRKALMMRLIDRRGGYKKREIGTKEIHGLNFRVVVNGSFAYGYTSSLEKCEIERLLKSLIKIAKLREKDRAFKGLPDPKTPSHVVGIYDKELENPDLNEITNYLRNINFEVLGTNQDIITVKTGFISIIGEKIVANTRGIDVSFRESIGEYFMTVNIASNDRSRSYYDLIQSRYLKDLSLDEIKEEALEFIDLSSKRVEWKSGRQTAIFHPIALNSLLRYTLVEAINGYNVTEGKSYLANKLGEEIAPKELNIIDDGTLKNGLRTAPVDDEGSPTRRIQIISKGVLEGFLYDHYTAGIANVESTGNAFREMKGGIHIDARNLVVSSKLRELEELLSYVERGILVRDILGAHGTNVGSGAFFVSSPRAFVIQKGCIVGSIGNATISGIFSDVLKNYVAAGGKIRTIGYLTAPYMAFKGIDVVID